MGCHANIFRFFFFATGILGLSRNWPRKYQAAGLLCPYAFASATAVEGKMRYFGVVAFTDAT